jgi:hypothetical protein
LEESVIAPLMAPIAFGVKVTWIVQVDFGASPIGQSLVWEKSPLALMLVIVRLLVPLLVRVTVCGALGEAPGLTTCGAKLKLFTEKLTSANWKQPGRMLNSANVRASKEYLCRVIAILPLLQAEDRAAA